MCVCVSINVCVRLSLFETVSSLQKKSSFSRFLSRKNWIFVLRTLEQERKQDRDMTILLVLTTVALVHRIFWKLLLVSLTKTR